MSSYDLEKKLQVIVEHAWDSEVRWPHIDAWAKNFSGEVLAEADERKYGLFALSKFMYFGKRLVREMLKALYRDHFEAPLKQRIRRHLGGTLDLAAIHKIYQSELLGTRFIGVGNPAESGAHLLYYFRQVNHLPKSLFVDLAGAFFPVLDQRSGKLAFKQKDSAASRYVFFDDLVGSGTQVSRYLADPLKKIKLLGGLDVRFMSLFATSAALSRLNEAELFNGKATCLFELDDSYKAFDSESRYFRTSPSWFDKDEFKSIAKHYGERLQPGLELGYKDGQLLLGFSHNTPDNTLPIFWDEGFREPWTPIFVRYDKIYGGKP